MSDTEKKTEQRVSALEEAVLALHERCCYLEQTNAKILSCLRLTNEVAESLRADIESLTGTPKPAAPKPGGPVLQ